MNPTHLRALALALPLLLGARAAAAPATTSITVVTEPPGAEVVRLTPVPEVLLGTSPVRNVRVPQGEIKLRFRLAGHQEQIETVLIGKSSQTFNFRLVRQVLPGTLELSGAAEFLGAGVQVDGAPQGMLPAKVQVPPGRHQIVIAKPGYVTYERWVEVSEGQKASFDIVLVKAEAPKGTLLVTSTPSGAVVKVDGQASGVTPALLQNVAAGDHAVEVTLADHKPFTQLVKLAGGGSATVEAKLEALAKADGTLELSGGANETGAQVLVDGQARGTLPATLKAAPGRHQVLVQKPGFLPWERAIDVQEGQRMAYEVVLRPASAPTGSLLVTSNPAGAQVRVNGTPRGPSPTLVDGLPPGSTQVELLLAGHRPFTRFVLVEAEKRTNLEAVLEPDAAPTGSMFVTSTPSGAQVKLNGEPRGPTPAVLEGLPAGEYVVELAATGFAAQQRTARVEAGKRIIVDVALASGARSKGDLKVIADADDVQVLVDGDPAGTAPVLRRDLDPGMHIVEARLAGLPTARRDVEVKAGQLVTVSLELREAAAKVSGEIRIVAAASDAKASIDGGEPAPVPLTKVLPAGTHFVTVTAPCCAPWKSTFQVAAGEKRDLAAQLVATGKLRIVLPAGQTGEVLLDGQPAGVAPITLDVAEGSHNLVVRVASGAQDTRTVVVAAGSLQTVEADLRMPEKPKEKIDRRPMPFSAAAMLPSSGSVDLGLGWPQLVQVRMSGGIVDNFDMGLTIKSQIWTITEFELRGRVTFAQSRAFAVGAEAGVGYGLGIRSRSGFSLRASGLGSVFIANAAALTLSLSAVGYTDRLGDAADPRYASRVTGLQTLAGIATEFKFSPRWNLYIRFEGDPFMKAGPDPSAWGEKDYPFLGGRPMYSAVQWLPGNTRLGGAAGFSALF